MNVRDYHLPLSCPWCVFTLYVMEQGSMRPSKYHIVAPWTCSPAGGEARKQRGIVLFLLYSMLLVKCCSIPVFQPPLQYFSFSCLDSYILMYPAWKGVYVGSWRLKGHSIEYHSHVYKLLSTLEEFGLRPAEHFTDIFKINCYFYVRHVDSCPSLLRLVLNSVGSFTP